MNRKNTVFPFALNWAHICLLLSCLTFLALSIPSQAYAQSAASFDPYRAQGGRQITLTQGKAEIVKTSHNISDIIIANPDVADVRVIQSNHLSIIGLALGNTNILLLDEHGELVQSLNIQVSIDEKGLRRAIKSLFPEENVKVSTVNDDIILSGEVSSAATASAIRDIATRFSAEGQSVANIMDVAGAQQVMIKVRVLEVSRSALNELGIETEIAGPFANSEAAGALSVTDSLGLTIDPSYAIGSLTYSNGGIGPLNIIMRALERDGMVNTLAEPNLTAISGENARFLAGGEFPIPTSRDNDGNIVYEYRPFGVSLAFRPVVLSNDQITLQILSEVSEISTEQTLQLPGITVPSFTVRRAETTVELGSGGSLVLAGLIESQAIRQMNEVPGLRKLPIIGDLISSESFQRNESELMIMVTAYTVKPFSTARVEADEEQKQEPEQRTASITQLLHQNLEDRVAGNDEESNKIRSIKYILD